ncbi:MAG: hypothetical protein CEE43_13715 [Promethearchaeota archaeon Loki_b32]|nr:MAG: hypothetical protein CEE43_13715 [Candidatus Lokiarchaeota archaeon Loki_b32]
MKVIQIKSERKAELINSLKLCFDLQDKDIEPYFSTLREIGIKLNKNKSITNFSKFSNVLGNETRLKIVELLNDKDYCVCELEAILDKAQSSISHHLKILEGMRIIRGIKRGYFTHYELVKEQFQKYIENSRKFFELFNFV